jgi:hypothetical protein
MLSFPFEPQYMPCPECGASLSRAERDDHACDRGRWLKYQMFQLREETECFEAELGEYLASHRGRFEVWDAERRRLERGGDSAG